VKNVRTIPAVLFAVLLASCMGGTVLETHLVDDSSAITGTCRVILYGGRGARDLSTIAILDKEGDGHEITPKALGFTYAVTEPRDAQRAVREAFEFVERYDVYRHERILVSRIQAGDGTTIGYEIRSHWKPFIFGTTDPLTVSYVLEEGGKVGVAIRVQSIREEQGE
jgi:hypothetical protein